MHPNTNTLYSTFKNSSKRSKPRVPPWNHLLLNGATSDPEEGAKRKRQKKAEIKRNVFIMKA